MRYSYLKKPSGAVDERVRWWHEEIERGIARRKAEEKDWDHNEKYENLEQWADVSGNSGDIVQRAGHGDEVTVNKVAAYIKTHMSAVVPRNPKPRVKPKTSDGYEPVVVPVLDGSGVPREEPDGRIQVKEVMLHQAREDMIADIVGSPGFGLRKTIERVVKAGDLGYGCVKVTYRPHFKTPRKKDEPQTIDIAEDGSLDMSKFARSKIDGGLVTEEGDKRLVEKDDIPVWEDYRFDFVTYRRMIVDPECENDSDGMRWIIEEEMAVLEDVKADPLYDNTDDLQAGTYEDDSYDTDDITMATEWSDSAYRDDKSKRILLFHIWDLVDGKYMVAADGHGEFLRDGPPPDGIKGHPYGFYRPTEIIGEWYPRPRTTDLAPINDAFNIFYQKWIQAAGHATVKVLTWEDSLDPEAMEALTNDVNYEVVRIKRAGHPGSLHDKVAAFATPPMSADIYAQALKQLDKEFYEVGGIPPEALGTPKSETATQASMMGAYNSSRMDMDRETLAGMFRVLFKKLNDLIDATMTRERAVRLRGTDGQAFVGVVDPDLIYCDCDMDVDVEDMAPDNTQMQMANRLQLLQIAGQAPWQFETETLARGWCDPLGIKDPNFIRELAEAAKMQADAIRAQMMAAGAGAPGPSPEAGAPESEAGAISQAGGGTQVRNMQGAT